MYCLTKFRCNKHIFCRRNISVTKDVRGTADRGVMNVFDRLAKLSQRERAALQCDAEDYDYLRDEIGKRLCDRISDIKRKFNVVIDLGCGRGHVAKHLTSKLASHVIMCDVSSRVLQQAKTPSEGVTFEKKILDEENFSFKDNSVDLVISNLALHWVNDLPTAFSQILSCLKPDCVFMASMFGGDTLFELRSSLQLAEIERDGGISPHVSPFTEIRDIGGLLSAAGFTMLTIDMDEIVVQYPSIFQLIRDLKGMGENNAAWNRCSYLKRETLFAAGAIYEEMYGNNGYVPATFKIINFIGWKSDPSQPKPAKRGTGQMSLSDLGRFDKINEGSQR